MEQERKQLGDAELEIMQVIWQTEGAVSQVGLALPPLTGGPSCVSGTRLLDLSSCRWTDFFDL